MLIHKMRLDEYMAVLDVNSGAVHLVDDVIYDFSIGVSAKVWGTSNSGEKSNPSACN